MPIDAGALSWDAAWSAILRAKGGRTRLLGNDHFVVQVGSGRRLLRVVGHQASNAEFCQAGDHDMVQGGKLYTAFGVGTGESVFARGVCGRVMRKTLPAPAGVSTKVRVP